MLLLTIRSLGYTYDMNNSMQRRLLESDLMSNGFFRMEGNIKYVGWLPGEIKIPELKEIVAAIMLWERTREPLNCVVIN